MSFQVEIGVFLSYAEVCGALLVLESSQHCISTLTQFSQNSEENKKFFC